MTGGGSWFHACGRTGGTRSVGAHGTLDQSLMFDPACLTTVSGNRTVDLTDTIGVLGYFGDAGASSAGNARDRHAPISLEPWRTAEANDGVDLTDAIVNLASFGDDCSGAP